MGPICERFMSTTIQLMPWNSLGGACEAPPGSAVRLGGSSSSNTQLMQQLFQIYGEWHYHFGTLTTSSSDCLRFLWRRCTVLLTNTDVQFKFQNILNISDCLPKITMKRRFMNQPMICRLLVRLRDWKMYSVKKAGEGRFLLLKQCPCRVWLMMAAARRGTATRSAPRLSVTPTSSIRLVASTHCGFTRFTANNHLQLSPAVYSLIT